MYKRRMGDRKWKIGNGKLEIGDRRDREIGN
jgi:hypothetical protein